MKKVEYKYDTICRIIGILDNQLHLTGIDNARGISEIARLLETGIVKEIPDKPSKEDCGKEEKEVLHDTE